MGSLLTFLSWLKLATSNLEQRLSLPSPITKSYPEEKVGVALGKGSSLQKERKKERKCNDLKCVRKPTKSRLSLTHHANKSRQKLAWPSSRELPKIWGFPFNIYATAEASDFKFGTQLGFAKAHDKITCRRKGKHGPGLGELHKIWGFPSIFTQWLKLVTSNLVYSLGLPSPIMKSHLEEKVRVALGYGSSQIFGVPL